MKYEVRFQVGGEDRATEVEADDAATAARMAQETFGGSDDVFELIQVHLLDDMSSLSIDDDQTPSD